MGDKSPKAKRREKNQKSKAKLQTKSDLARRQAAFASVPAKETKK